MTDIKALIYVENNKLTYFIPGMEHPVTMAFPTAGISFMEVLDKELVYNQIQTFAVSNKLSPCEVTVVLGNEVVFQKVIRKTQQEQKGDMIEEFLTNVPFDNVAHIKYETADTTYVLATNEELFTTVRRGFEKLGFSVDAVIPVALIANANVPPGSLVTVQIASFILASLETVRQFNFINVERESAIKAAKKGKAVPKKRTKREKVLGGVFAGLLVVLMVVFLASGSSTAPTSTQASPDEETTVQTAAPTLAAALSPTGVADAKSFIAIKIVNSQAAEDNAGKVKSALEQSGFTAIENESTSSATTSVSFADTMDETYKNEILTILRPLIPDFTVLSHAGSAFQTILTIGN